MIEKPLTCVGCPLYEPPYGKHWGMSRPDGTGLKGVMIIAEALGESEEEAGIALIGKAGHYLFSNLARAGIEREGFTLFNVVACRPPNNKLVKQPYEEEAIRHCAPNLDRAIDEARAVAQREGKTFTIVTLGVTAFKRVMGFTHKSPEMHEDYLCYPFWNEKYQAWVIAADHPSYLMRGNHHLLPPLQFAFKRALEIAESGLKLDYHQYLLDPLPATFEKWVEDYMRVLHHDPENTFLSYDIETPYKQGKNEEDIAKEENDDYRILRCSFCYQPNYAVSIPWRAEYMPALEELFGYDGTKVGWNSASYDDQRVMAQLTMNGNRLDAMLAWHVLNSSLPKGLGFVTPFYAQTVSMWKHLSSDEPAFYNAKDADMALRCWLGIRDGLKENKQWHVFDRHVIKINKVFGYMGAQGVLMDKEMRAGAEAELAKRLDGVQQEMEAAIPVEARKLKIYKKVPKNTEGMQLVDSFVTHRVCLKCGELKPSKKHAERCDGEKGTIDFPTQLWAKPLEFKVSKVSMMKYQKVLVHQAIINRKENKATFDEAAITRLMKKYPKDKLYPKILEHREYQKLLSTYIGITQASGAIRGGMPLGQDGRIHTLFTHNPSTLRSASQNPNLQNLPRPKGPDDLATVIRNLIMAGPGCTLYARDYSGIEAVLVGYFAMLKDYIRLAKMDVHSFYTAYGLYELDHAIAANDLPLLSWDDEKLAAHLAGIKKEFKKDRNNLYKHLVHGANFMQGAKGAKEKIFLETGHEYAVSLVQKVMDIYFELFPGIRNWHRTTLGQAEKDGFLRNPFGYIHRFHKVYEYEKIGGKWNKQPGPEANKVIAFGPQSTAAGVIKEAMIRLFFDRFEEAGQYLRLLVHDELFSEVPDHLLDVVDKVMIEEMEKPIPELVLPASYGMGKCLNILTEAKRGPRWGGMH